MNCAALSLGLSLGLGWLACVSADTVTTKDGRRFTGEVTKSDSGYKVKTKFGEVTVSDGDFGEWIKDGAGTGPVKPATPAAPIPPRVRPAPPTPGGPKKAADPKLVDALLKQGRGALAAGEYKAACDAFHDVADVDPKNVEALHGLGVACMYLNDFTHALAPMEKAIAANPTPNRALVANMGVCQIGQPGSKNAMRAAIIIKDYLAAHPGQLDEPLLNAMATALYVADDQAKKGAKFQECATFYKTYNDKLEAARPGMKRWGVQWMDARTVDERNVANARIDKQVQSINRDMDQLDAQIADRAAELDRSKDLFRRGYVSEYKLNELASVLKVLNDTMEKKQKDHDDAMAKYERPTFPKAMTLVAMDDLTPPAVAAGVSVALSTPSGENLIAPTPVKRTGTKPKPDPKSTEPKETAKIETKMPEEPVISVVRQPVTRQKVRITSYAAAFPISDTLVLTAAAPLAGASEIELQTNDGASMKAEVVRVDEAQGLALLRVSGKKLVPLVFAPSFTGGMVQCAAFPTVNIFIPMAEPIPGTAKPPAGDWKISLSRHPRLGGSPILAGNKVVGMELASRETDASQVPAASLEMIRKFLSSDLPASSGLTPEPCAVMLQVMATRDSL